MKCKTCGSDLLDVGVIESRRVIMRFDADTGSWQDEGEGDSDGYECPECGDTLTRAQDRAIRYGGVGKS